MFDNWKDSQEILGKYCTSWSSQEILSRNRYLCLSRIFLFHSLKYWCRWSSSFKSIWCMQFLEKLKRIFLRVN